MKNTNVTTENKELEMPEPTLQDTIDKNVEVLWKEFQNVPVDRNGNLKAVWYAFPKGTNKNTVYDWFNRHYSSVVIFLRRISMQLINEKYVKKTVVSII